MNKTETSLEQLQWKKRPLLIFAESSGKIQYDRQLRAFDEQSSQVQERDMLLVAVAADAVGVVFTEGLSLTDSADSLRERFDVNAEQFAVILVGKDGTEKSRESSFVSPEKIFAEIDAMPMRQREMKAE